MCYLIAKKVDDIGSVALQTDLGQHLVDLKKSLIEKVGYDRIQLVTISRPSAYGKYERNQSRPGLVFSGVSDDKTQIMNMSLDF